MSTWTEVEDLAEQAEVKKKARRVAKASAFRHFDRGMSSKETAALMNLNPARIGIWRREWKAKRENNNG